MHIFLFKKCYIGKSKIDPPNNYLLYLRYIFRSLLQSRMKFRLSVLMIIYFVRNLIDDT